MGQGYALSENYPSVNGHPPWRRLDYGRLGVPTSLTATSVRVEIVEDPFPAGWLTLGSVSETRGGQLEAVIGLHDGEPHVTRAGGTVELARRHQ